MDLTFGSSALAGFLAGSLGLAAGSAGVSLGFLGAGLGSSLGTSGFFRFKASGAGWSTVAWTNQAKASSSFSKFPGNNWKSKNYVKLHHLANFSVKARIFRENEFLSLFVKPE